ncbi:Protein LURP-one-related 12 [Hibiscus syriacus]|uniref:Protein LURP-one-related 12 n=1 Tax=Hibiscus syriacus TaxID=106335 RepID=A0A6A2X2Z3_HIBSY|nr:Protein LURP-one-related 12 [Hibiscus syriacus]
MNAALGDDGDYIYSHEKHLTVLKTSLFFANDGFIVYDCKGQLLFLNENKESMAEIKRKVDASTNVVLGKEVFLLSLKPGFDGAFAMGLVLVIDQINGDDHLKRRTQNLILEWTDLNL